MTEDEMVGRHHQLYGHGFGWTPGIGDGQGGLVCCSPWGRKESDMTERQLNWQLNAENAPCLLLDALLSIVFSSPLSLGL